ncbi:MAG: P27 family phage terminase small subunit, partial [Candidatus Limnocylindria bacterium]
MTANRLPTPPRYLSDTAKSWWRGVVADYELDESSLKLLTEAATAWDRIQQARVLLESAGLTFTDRFGTPRRHPAVGIESEARIAFARLLRELDLEGSPLP